MPWSSDVQCLLPRDRVKQSNSPVYAGLKHKHIPEAQGFLFNSKPGLAYRHPSSNGVDLKIPNHSQVPALPFIAE